MDSTVYAPKGITVQTFWRIITRLGLDVDQNVSGSLVKSFENERKEKVKRKKGKGENEREKGRREGRWERKTEGLRIEIMRRDKRR